MPEVDVLMRKSRASLQKEAIMRRDSFPEEAGRLAYIAGHPAAVAWIFQVTGKGVKTHGGTHSEFARLIKDDPRFGLLERQFLGRAYRYKQTADYGASEADTVSDGDADTAIAEATNLVAKIEAALQETTKETPP